MKADFEKGTKVCSKCKMELPIEMFCKNKTRPDGLQDYCKECSKISMDKYYYENHDKMIVRSREYYKINRKAIRKKDKERADKNFNTFQRCGHNRGNCSSLKRDYELTKEQLKRRENKRKKSKVKKPRTNAHGILIWYSGELNSLTHEEYEKILSREYSLQKICAIRGYMAQKYPSEHFLFDFDLEQMLKDKCYYTGRNKNKYITKWWDGEIRHWTVNDGIWKK